MLYVGKEKVECPVSINVRRLNAVKYVIGANDDVEEEDGALVTVSVDREYFNFELEDETIVYSIRTSDMIAFFLACLRIHGFLSPKRLVMD